MRLRALTGSHGLRTLTVLTCLATTVACGGGGAPALSGMEDQVAQVGVELTLDLYGTDPDGDRLSYGFRAGSELMDLADRATVSVSPAGSGVFRWTPNASDVGAHAIDFTVSDGDSEAVVTVTIDVRSAIGSATAPIFRQPLGSGTTIDLGKKKCVDLDIVVDDQDTAQVSLTMEEPLIEGATLEQQDGQTARFRWCPTRAQEAETRYTLVLAADDGDNPKTLKNYLVVLRGGGGASCPGAAPVIQHTAMDAMTIVGLTIDARVTDDKGLKDAPLVYYSTTPPANPPVLGDMLLAPTIKIDGTPRDAIYAADVPNPVANLPQGSARTLYYVFSADDDDDATGSCDHNTTSQVYSMVVTSSGAANQPICATCTADAQCGGGDLCVYMGAEGASYCLEDCAGGCPTGYACSASPLSSVDGAQGLQCVPQSGSCAAPTGACVDDDNENDDNRTQASANAAVDGPFDPDAYYLVSCPKPNPPATGAKSDDDWFQLRTTADTLVDLLLYGNGESDLDLALYRSDGTLLSASTSLEADENIKKCLPAGTYYVKVNGYDPVRSEYVFDRLDTAQTCATACVDDAREDDDTYSQARPTTQPTYSSTGNTTCPNDDDYYRTVLFTGDRLTIDLTFTQSNPSQDLDLHLYRGFTDLWPCSPQDPTTCDAAHGQGTRSNERAVFTAPAGCDAGCDYDVVVRGYNGAQNTYGITLRVD